MHTVYGNLTSSSLTVSRYSNMKFNFSNRDGDVESKVTHCGFKLGKKRWL